MAGTGARDPQRITRTFSANPVHYHLAVDAHRIRLAYEYDPHFAVSVSQIGPRPSSWKRSISTCYSICECASSWPTNQAQVEGVAQKHSERIKAGRFGAGYWLYIVVNCRKEP